jgi:endonuclease/exonuclease/phosphatase family metal-dependent hydrolase
VHPRVTGQYPRLVFFVASIALLMPRADATQSPARCEPKPLVAGAAATLHPANETFRVGSLNMAADARTSEVLEDRTRKRSIDVLLLQEVGDDGVNGEVLIASLSSRLGFGFVFAPANLLQDGATEGLAIVSRYPLDDISVRPLPYHDLPLRSRCRVALGATVETPAGPVRIVNVHLDTRINGASRIAQLTPAMDMLAVFDGPRILGGDLNTMDIRWVWAMVPLFYMQGQSDAVRTWLFSRGFDTPFTDTPPTLSFPILPMRVDWLYLKEFESLAAGVDRIRFSDHRGIWAHVDPTRRVTHP